MKTVHIHIKGLVQGVGFRPHVYALATSLGLKGYVNNSSDGVHIVAQGKETDVEELYHSLIATPPIHAIITHHHQNEIASQPFDRFCIAESEDHQSPDLMLTPDLGMCDSCRQELFDPRNRRYHYPFITCIHCGPRYSITTALPYDRCNTTMDKFEQCTPCRIEYFDPTNRRYYSQTNSCTDCGIHLGLYELGSGSIEGDAATLLQKIKESLEEGRIVAVKGIGGFLLMCDAASKQAILTLRQRKNRPAKPLALLYPDIETVEQHCRVTDAERQMLLSSRAPVVLCETKAEASFHLALKQIATGLNRIGVMLPYAPLLAMIATKFEKALVATSANISGSPILYKNEDAISALDGIADLVLLHDRDIVAPQDDSVVQYSAKHQQFIMLRRSRGWAPNFYPCSLPGTDETILAMGGELKASFAIQQQQRCFVSQFLGDQGCYESQQSYRHTLQQLCGILKARPDRILADKHPAYETSAFGKELSVIQGIPLVRIQHHVAHAAAVLAENNLLKNEFPILCLTWDGTGYGDDGQVWGSECFVYNQGKFDRTAHLDYFPVLMGDKMSKEPRLSALSLLHSHPEVELLLAHKFNGSAWSIYKNALGQLNMPQTSSMGRLLDGIASILGLIDISFYEGHAAMVLQALAETCNEQVEPYLMPLQDNNIQWPSMIESVIHDMQNGVPAARIARRVHLSLATLVIAVADSSHCQHIAVSGGVWQNGLLVDMLIDLAKGKKRLYFHQQLPPNDECISFGQLASYAMRRSGEDATTVDSFIVHNQ